MRIPRDIVVHVHPLLPQRLTRFGDHRANYNFRDLLV